MDVIIDRGGKKIGIEVKTFTDNANDKVTMHPDARKRKERWARKEKASLYTVVVDARDKFDGGKNKEQFSGNRYYIAKGVGSFRLQSMRPVGASELRTLL